MNNILLALIPTILTTVVSTAAIVYYTISKPDYYVLKIIAFIGITIVMFYFATPYFQDLSHEETTTIVAKYDGFHRNSKVGTRKVFFVGENCRYELFVPGYSGDVGKLEIGKIYEIEYFNNSKLIKSYSLID